MVKTPTKCEGCGKEPGFLEKFEPTPCKSCGSRKSIRFLCSKCVEDQPNFCIECIPGEFDAAGKWGESHDDDL